MTARVERTFDIPLPCERVWEFIADPENRANAISVVKRFELHETDGDRATWYIALPLLGTEVPVQTRDVAREPPNYVQFVGRSKVLKVTGEHRLEPTDEGCRLHNRFVVDGRFPGVEGYFQRNLDRELTNLESALRAELSID